MPNQNELIWSCHNDYDTEIKYVKGSTRATPNQGVCAGLAIEWCKNLLNGKRPVLSKPFLLQGMLYQRFYDWGTDDATRNSNMFAKASVSAGTRRNGNSAHRSADVVWNVDGVFWGGYNNHAIAVAKTAGSSSQLFFDPNFGCYAVHSKSRLAELFDQGRDAVDAENNMEFYPITLD